MRTSSSFEYDDFDFLVAALGGAGVGDVVSPRCVGDNVGKCVGNGVVGEGVGYGVPGHAHASGFMFWLLQVTGAPLQLKVLRHPLVTYSWPLWHVKSEPALQERGRSV